MTRPTLDLALLAAWNAANKAAVEFNRRRPLREQLREAYYIAKRGER